MKKVKTSDPIRFVGGGALSPVTCQMLADITGRTIETVNHSQEVGAIGTALVVAAGIRGVDVLELSRQLVKANHAYTPNPAGRISGAEGYLCLLQETGGVSMFRPMRRYKQQISQEECIRILRKEKRGVLSMIGENGYPYGIPLNHWYNPEDGKLYFHGAKEGHKLDALRKDNRVSYCVWDAGYRKEDEWALNVNSVIVFGRISLVTDEEKAKQIGINLCRKFTDDKTYIQHEIENALPRAQCLELTIDHMTGKLVNES